jgi:hypothetical protein
MGEAKIGSDDSLRHVRWLTLEGIAGSVGGKVCRNLSLKIEVKSASALMV